LLSGKETQVRRIEKFLKQECYANIGGIIMPYTVFHEKFPEIAKEETKL